jgi:hypothetical protein
VEVDPGDDRDDQDGCDEPVDSGAKRRSPSCVGNVLAALLPGVLEPVAGVTKHHQPRRPGDGRRGQQDEQSGDRTLHGDYPWSSVGHREPDVDRGDQGQL